MIHAENPVQNQEKLPPQPVVKVFGFASPNPLDNQAQTNNSQQTKIQNNTESQKSVESSQTQMTIPRLNIFQKFEKKINHMIPGKVFHWWHKIAVVLLTFHGLAETWEAIKFMVIEYPELEHLLSIHQVKTEDVNSVVAVAILGALDAMINIFMAIRLHKVTETTAHNIDLFFATIIILGTNYFKETLIQFDLLNIFMNLIK